jgi:hypothetical protein
MQFTYHPDGGGSKNLKNINQFQPQYIAKYGRRHSFSDLRVI